MDEEGGEVTGEQRAPITISYEKGERNRAKELRVLARSDLLFAAIQVVGDGGETNLHAHEYLDGFWFVLRGRARFYTTDDELLGEFGPEQGLLIPRGYPYWFEAVGDGDLEILQLEASSRLAHSIEDFATGRIDYEPKRSWYEDGASELLENDRPS